MIFKSVVMSLKITVLSNKDTENKTFKQEIFLSSNDYMDDSLADIKTTVKTVVFI